MNRPYLLVALWLAPQLSFAQPVRTVWIRAAMPGGATSAVSRVLPDVHSVEFTDREAVVRSAGLSLVYLGLLEASPLPRAGIREFVFHIPLKPQPEPAGQVHVPSGFVGAFVNGVPIYNQFEAASYRGQNLWHYDLVARADDGTLTAAGHPRPDLTHASHRGLIEDLIPDRGRHSPIIGFALDGFPIYGPWGNTAEGMRRMRSSYQLRKISTRETWPDGTVLAPGQEGPPVSAGYPLGTFVEDYEYVAGSGDLDRSNGRIVRTPEYPEGTYAYFLATDARGRLAFPYLLAHEFFGRYGSAPPPARTAGARGGEVRLEFLPAGVLTAGRPVNLQFRVFDSLQRSIRYLEYVHERPIHLMIVSRDLADFAHIHPEVDENGVWEVTHSFAQGGRYRFYADFTPPGSNQRIQFFDVTVQGKPRAGPPLTSSLGTVRAGKRLPVTLAGIDGLRAGADVELNLQLGTDPASVAGLQPYLGAWAHVAIAGAGLSSFIHAHPVEEGSSPIRVSEEHVHTPESMGPPPQRFRVATSFPKAGLYKVWVQIQVEGEVETAPFVVRVAKPTPARVAHTRIPAGAISVRIGPGGFEPLRIVIAAGKPVTLAFLRMGEPNCGGKVLFPELGITREIPLGGVALVELPPRPAGEVRLTCGMGMYRGSIIAVAGAER